MKTAAERIAAATAAGLIAAAIGYAIAAGGGAPQRWPGTVIAFGVAFLAVLLAAQPRGRA
jgi:uncharacterized membrane protein YbhN (UPF0104 family)